MSAGGRGGRCSCEDAPAAVAGAVEDVGAGVDDGRGHARVPVPHHRVEGGPGAQYSHRFDLVDLPRGGKEFKGLAVSHLHVFQCASIIQNCRGSNLPGRWFVPGVMRGRDDDGAGVTVVTAVVTPAVVTPVTPRGGPQRGPGLAVRPLVSPSRDRRTR